MLICTKVRHLSIVVCDLTSYRRHSGVLYHILNVVHKNIEEQGTEVQAL